MIFDQCRSYIHIVCLLGLSLIVVSCGYRAGAGGDMPPMTLSIPFIKGDKDGIFTASIIKEVSARTSFIYNPDNPQTTLVIKILDLDDENVGFRYDRKRSGKIRHNVVPVETRLAVQIEMTLYRNYDSVPILGPMLVEASVDFDHEYYPNRDAVNVFSLGQLTDYDAARDAAIFPLSRELARRVADRLIFCRSEWVCE